MVWGHSENNNMLMTLLLMMMLTLSPTPMKMAVLLVMVSVILSVFMMWNMSIIFLPSSIIISFSTGMMIMFCYCSNLSPLEKKENSSHITMLLIFSVMLIFSDMETDNSFLNNYSTVNFNPLTLVLIMIILSMVSMNILLKSSRSTMMISY